MKIRMPVLTIASQKKTPATGTRSHYWEELNLKLREGIKKSQQMGEALSLQENIAADVSNLLDEGREEYFDLYRSRFSVLSQVATEVLNCERRGYIQIAQELENMLSAEGIERFVPVVGEPVTPGLCIAIGKKETLLLPSGSVAKVAAPGFCTLDKKTTILPAEVYRAIHPKHISQTLISCCEIDDPDGFEFQVLFHFMRFRTENSDSTGQGAA